MKTDFPMISVTVYTCACVSILPSLISNLEFNILILICFSKTSLVLNQINSDHQQIHYQFTTSFRVEQRENCYSREQVPFRVSVHI